VLILNEATATIDGASQGRILKNLLSEFEDRGVIWVVHRAALAESFDQILVLQAGRVVEEGTYEALSIEGSALTELMNAE
tara:strand:- start:17529 stop:17768 length:240 start_codon:yes stop_codon:yes gene_type:complete